eukprot:747277-Alexandrium_andersonii.AAC.1
MCTRDQVLQEVAILDSVLLLGHVEVGVGSVELRGAGRASEGVELEVQRVAAPCLTQLEEGLPFHGCVPCAALLLE